MTKINVLNRFSTSILVISNSSIIPRFSQHTVLILFFCWVNGIAGQEALGFKFGNYAGTERIFLNPALSQSSAFKWEVNLASLHAFAYTDYAFIRETSLLSLVTTDDMLEVVNYRSQVVEKPTVNSLIFDLDGGNKKLSGHFELSGPALIMNFFSGFKIGVFSKLRGNVSSQGIAENFGVYELSESFNRQVINFNKTQISGMLWREIGLHLSKSLETFDIGINIKRQNAYEGFFAKIDTDQDISYANGIVAFGSNDLAGGLGYTRNGIYANNFDPLDTQDHGSGLSIDLGIRFNIDDIGIGVSLIDLGYISFAHHVENYALPDNYTDFNVDPNDYLAVRSLDDLISQVETDTPFEPFFNHRGFKIGLPTALNISADYQLDKNYFVSASATQRIKILNTSTVSDNALSVIPRFQSNWVSAYLPVTVYNYSQLRVGAAARLAYLTIGSDDLMSVFRKSDFRGSDIYIKLSVTPLFKIKSRNKSGSKISGSSAKCYEF